MAWQDLWQQVTWVSSPFSAPQRHAGGTTFCAPVGHRQVKGDYHESWQPQAMSSAALAESERVARAVETATRTYSSVHRGTGWLSRVTSAHYEAARDEVARFVGAREDGARDLGSGPWAATEARRTLGQRIVHQ